MRDASVSHDSRNPERMPISTEPGFHKTFKIHIFLRIAAAAFLLGVSCFLAIGAVAAIYLILRGDGGATLHKAIMLLVVAAFGIVLFVSMTIRFLRARIEISSRGITDGSAGAFRERLIPWEDIVGLRQERGGDSRIILENGDYISFATFARQEELAQMVEATLDRFGRRGTQVDPGVGFHETFQRCSPRSPKKCRDVVRILLSLAVLMVVAAVTVGVYGAFAKSSESALLASIIIAILLAAFAFLLTLVAYLEVEDSARRIEISGEGIRWYYSSEIRAGWPSALFREWLVPWNDITQVSRRKTQAGLLLTSGTFVSVKFVAGEERMLALIEAKLEKLRQEGHKPKLKKLKKNAIAAFVLGVFVIYAALAIIAIISMRQM